MSTSWNLSQGERAEITRKVSQLHQQLVAEAATTSVSLWGSRPAPDTWSPEEVVEHVLLAETSLLRRIVEHSQDSPQAEWEARLQGKEDLLRKVLPGEGRAKAGASVTMFQGLAFDGVPQAFAKSEEFLEQLLFSTRDLPLKAILWNNRWFGDLSLFLWLLYIPLHGERHLGQLRRIKAKQLQSQAEGHGG